MKKALFFLFLFAIAACTSVQEYDSEDEIVLQLSKADIKKGWEKVKRFTKEAKIFLKSIGVYDILVQAVKIYGRAFGISACVAQGIDATLCTMFVNWAFSYLK